MNCGGVQGGAGAAAAPYETKIAGLYDLLDTLGSGHFAVVKLARHVFTGEKVAVKVIDKSKLDDVSKSHLFQEVRCMKLVQHPNVVRLYDVIDTQTKLYLILELGDGGDLYDYIMRHETGLTESLARDYFRQIVRAISYCHRLHVVHRDLKPENVVFFERLGVVKLTDFGFSNKFCPGQKLETSCGSLAYSAPEILLGDSYDAPAVDVWSLGVILYMLVCGQAPFQEANDSETLTMIMDCKYSVPQHMSSSCKKLIGRMLVREPEKRASLSEIAADPWVVAGQSGVCTDFDTPLVVKEQLSEEDRTLIVQKMVNGRIATKEEILDLVEKNEYNHVTATYYLLAERKLRAKRQEQSTARRPEALSVAKAGGCGGGGGKPGSNLLAPPAPHYAPRTPQDVPPRSRKCSIVREEEDDEEPCGVTVARRPSRSEGRLHLAARLREQRPPPPPEHPPPPPDTLQQLHPAAAPAAPPPPPPPPNARRPRRRAGAPRSGSESEPSEDEEERQRRAAAAEPAGPPARPPRRDSHDDSSDGQQEREGTGGGAASQPPRQRTLPRGSTGGGAGGGAGDAGAGGGGRRRRAARAECRLRESRSLNRIAEVEEARGARGAGLAALCGRLFHRARPATAAAAAAPARRLPGLC